MLWQGAALFDVNLCGMYANVGYDNTFYTKPFYCDGNTPYYLVENSWRPDNPDAEYPRLGIVSRDNGGKMSSWWVENGILHTFEKYADWFTHCHLNGLHRQALKSTFLCFWW